MHRVTRFFLCISAFLLILLAAAPAQAQFNGAIEGTVRDAQGGAVVGAKVTVINRDTGISHEAVTTSEGFYRVDALPPGIYTVRVEAPNFSKNETNSVSVLAEQVRGLNITMQIGQVTQTVTVSGTVAPTLQTEDANISGTITNQQVENLPAFGRDPYELLRLAPGVFGDDARQSNGNAQNLPLQPGPGGSNSAIFQIENQVQISSDGQRATANNYQVDGVSVNSLGWGGAAVITPNAESVKEIEVLSSTYSAEDGRNSGAQVKVVSKSGTNAFHGSGFAKFDDPGLNAFNDYNGPFGHPNTPAGSGIGRVDNKYRQFGGSIGGPVKRNSLFFFFSYEGLRQSNPSFHTGAIVETPEFRQYVINNNPNSLAAKVFSTPGIAPRIIAVNADKFGTPQVFDCCSFDPSIPLGGYYDNEPFGLGPAGIPEFENVNLLNPFTSSANQYNGRVDYTRGKDQFFYSTYFTHRDDHQGFDRPIDDLTLVPLNWIMTVAWDRTIGPSMLNDARFNVTRWSYNQVASSASTDFGVPFYNIFDFNNCVASTDPKANCLHGVPGCCINAGATRGATTPGVFAQNTYDFRDTFSKLLGRHALKFGVDVAKDQNNSNEQGGARPLFQFSSFLDWANDAPQFEAITVDPRTGSLAFGPRHFRTSIYALFVQDDWKLRPNLTLNLGLRWEYFSPLTETNNLISNYIFGPNGETDGTVVAGHKLYNGDFHHFGPRLGFAWSPNRFDNKLVVRGGFGVNYNRIYDNILDPVRFDTPFAADLTGCCAGPTTAPASVGIDYVLGTSNSPFSYPANPLLAFGVDPKTGGLCSSVACTSDLPITIFGSGKHLPEAYVYTYSFGFQYELVRDTTLQLGYSGSSAHKLIRTIDLNRLMPGDTFDDVMDFMQTVGSNGQPCGAGNPTCTAPHLTGNAALGVNGRIFFPLADVNANYNALLLRVNHRFSHGFLLSGAYTYSKVMDFASNEIGAQQDYPFNQKLDYGPADYNATNYFVFTGVWELPILRGRRDLLGDALGGWSLSGIYTYHTGFPWTPVSFGPTMNNPVGDGYRPDRPTFYEGTCINHPGNQEFESGVCPTTNSRPGNAPDDPNFPTLLTDCAVFNECFTTAFPRGGPPIGRNSFRGPRFSQVDFSAAKQFGIPQNKVLGESANLEFRANFFNAFNTLNLQPIPNFSANDDLSNTFAFGRVPGGLAGRVVEFQLRLQF
jgi:outer membrane receptor protein involved in Fe transport